MFRFLTNKKGSALIGLILAIVIIAALVYGGVFFWGNTDKIDEDTDITNFETPAGAIKALDKAKEDIQAIQENLNKQAELISDTEFDEYTITVTNIKAGDNLVSPVIIEGAGVAFENILIVELRNSGHETMVKEFVTVKAPDIGKSGPFKITLDFDFDLTKEGFVAVYEESAKDGSEVNLVEIPVKFNNPSDWQTYRNEEYGFEVGYPRNKYSDQTDKNVQSWEDQMFHAVGLGDLDETERQLFKNHYLAMIGEIGSHYARIYVYKYSQKEFEEEILGNSISTLKKVNGDFLYYIFEKRSDIVYYIIPHTSKNLFIVLNVIESPAVREKESIIGTFEFIEK